MREPWRTHIGVRLRHAVVSRLPRAVTRHPTTLQELGTAASFQVLVYPEDKWAGTGEIASSTGTSGKWGRNGRIRGTRIAYLDQAAGSGFVLGQHKSVRDMGAPTGVSE